MPLTRKTRGQRARPNSDRPGKTLTINSGQASCACKIWRFRPLGRGLLADEPGKREVEDFRLTGDLQTALQINRPDSPKWAGRLVR